MMIHAYPEIYVSKDQVRLGEAFDYAVNVSKIPGEDFVKLFVVSSISKQMEKGEYSIILGKSGIEIVLDVVLETKGKQIEGKSTEIFTRSKEYWIGWAIAYYQWYSARSYSEMFSVFSFEDLLNMYYPLHEADISRFVDIVDEKVKDYYKETNLKRFCSTYGCSQSTLAKLSGVSLRSIQMYEQRQKDINKASVETLYRISKVLGCTIEDLIEKFIFV